MERIKVILPKNFSFSTLLKIQITDINYGGHVGNQVFLSLIHEARIQFLKSYGYTELHFEGTGLIMADVALEYKMELDRSHEVRVSVAAQHFDKLGFDIYYLLEARVNNDWKLAAKAKTGMICYNYIAKKKVAVPEVAVVKLCQSSA